jgi:hypothetical protein
MSLTDYMVVSFAICIVYDVGLGLGSLNDSQSFFVMMLMPNPPSNRMSSMMILKA